MDTIWVKQPTSGANWLVVCVWVGCGVSALRHCHPLDGSKFSRDPTGPKLCSLPRVPPLIATHWVVASLAVTRLDLNCVLSRAEQIERFNVDLRSVKSYTKQGSVYHGTRRFVNLGVLNTKTLLRGRPRGGIWADILKNSFFP